MGARSIENSIIAPLLVSWVNSGTFAAPFFVMNMSITKLALFSL